MLFKGLTKKQSPLMENLKKKKDYIKSTPFNTHSLILSPAWEA